MTKLLRSVSQCPPFHSKRLFFMPSRRFAAEAAVERKKEEIDVKAQEIAKICSYDDVLSAYKRISGVVHRSPMDASPRLSRLTSAQIYLKKEHISITGSYKERGALNKLLQLSDEEKKRGVICASAGNHAQAVSYHATRLGIDAVIVMPETTPFVKVQATRSFGGKVVLSGSSFNEAFLKAQEIAEKERRVFVHAFNDSMILAGQGTVAMEMIEQNPYLDAVVVPIGGGGLIAGMALVLKHLNPRIKIYGVETVAMPGMYASKKMGKVVSVPKRPTMADGIAIENVGNVPFDIIKNLVDDIVLVEEDEIAAAVLALLELEKTVVEGSGATALAAIMAKKLSVKDQVVGVVCTGGNIDMNLLGRIIEKGMVKTGRLARVRVVCADVPGQLARVLNAAAACRANIRAIEHERAFLLADVQYTQPIITVETRGQEHIEELIRKIKDAGFDRVNLDTVHD